MVNKICGAVLLLLVSGAGAHAFGYDVGNFKFKLNGYGTGGMIQPKLQTPVFIGDWRVRAQLDYVPNDVYKLGLVYSIDAAATDDGRAMREAFGFYELRDKGRIEFGFTDSIARKLGVGLPDVGGLRINDRPIFHKKIVPDGPVISDTTLTTGRKGLRMNIVNVPKSGAQYGVSIAGITDDYDFTIDAGLKIRRPYGKLKTAWSFGASFMDRPHGFSTDVYAPAVTADWRAQFTAGMNVQYNSWIWGTTARVIYDDNPIGVASDGFVAGTGVSYDLMKYSVSLTYMFSDTGIWNRGIKDFMDHMLIGSFRYKYSENVDGWISLGVTSEKPFVSAGMRLTF